MEDTLSRNDLTYGVKKAFCNFFNPQMKLSVLLLPALLGLASAGLQDIVKKSAQHRKGIHLMSFPF